MKKKHLDIIIGLNRITPKEGEPTTFKMLKNKYRPDEMGIPMGLTNELVGFDTTSFLMIGINGPGFMRDVYLREEAQKLPMIKIKDNE
jgi:hypothetical protein